MPATFQALWLFAGLLGCERERKELGDACDLRGDESECPDRARCVHTVKGDLCAAPFQTGADLWKAASVRVGSFVVVERAEIGRGDTACTLVACPGDNPCCNTCGGSATLVGSEFAYLYHVTEGKLSCSGNECSVSCPYSGRQLRLVGKVVKAWDDKLALEHVSLE